VSLPFASHALKLHLTPTALLQNAKHLGFWHSTTSLVAILILALMQALTLKEQVFCSNAYKQALTTENEKSESSHTSEALGQTGDQTHLTLSFGPK